MADTNKVVPLPPGEEALDSNHVGYRWMPSLAEYQWWETQREDGTWRHTVCQPVEVEQRAQAYLDQQAQAQQDTAHTDWQARAEAAEARCQQLEAELDAAQRALKGE